VVKALRAEAGISQAGLSAGAGIDPTYIRTRTMTERKRIVFDLDERRTKIRYKRASLTVEQTVRIIITPVEEALTAYRAGAVTEEAVAEAFLREQIVAHSPSFDWEQADLGLLLKRVAAVMNDPKLKARTPRELVPELEAVEAKERERWAEISKGMTLQVGPLAKELQEKLQQPFAPTFTKEMQEMMLKQTQAISDSLVDSPALAHAMKEQVVKLHGGLSSIPASLIPKAGLFDAGLDPSVLEELRQGIIGSHAFRPVMTVDFDQLIEQALQVAQRVEAERTIDVGARGVEQVEAQVSDADIKAVVERLSEIAEAMQKQAGSNPLAMAIAATVISSLIVYVIQYVLAVKYGITPTPPEKPAP